MPHCTVDPINNETNIINIVYLRDKFIDKDIFVHGVILFKNIFELLYHFTFDYAL